MACGMVSLYDGYDYYKRLFELQERLRKSEEERIRLEERFNVLVRESRNRHDTCINRLRMRYIQYLEEQRTRDERNYKLLATLDRVMNKLMLINVKKDRLNVLRKRYEAHLLRVYANRQRPFDNTTTGMDSGIASQNEDRHARRVERVPKAKGLSSPRAQYPETFAAQLNHQPRSVVVSARSKFHDPRTDPPILPTTTVSSPSVDANLRRADYRETTNVHASPNDRLYPYPGVIPDGGASYKTLHDTFVPTDVSAECYAGAPILSTVSDAHRFAARESARYEGTPEDKFLPRSQIDTLTLLSRSRHADTSPSNLEARLRGYDDLADRDLATSLENARGSDRFDDASTYHLGGREKDESVRSFTSDDADGDRRTPWRYADFIPLPRSPRSILGTVNVDPNDGTTGILESELDRYIGNIQRLHRERRGVSDELEHEQNTSGDLLNVTLSENALDLPVDDRRTRRPSEPDREIEGFEGRTKSEDEERDDEEVREEDVATRSAELERRTSANANIATMENDPIDSSRVRDRELSVARKDETKDEVEITNVSSSTEKLLEVVTGEESHAEGFLDTVEELAPWNVESIRRNVRELRPEDRDKEDEIKSADKIVEEKIIEVETANVPPRSETATKGTEEDATRVLVGDIVDSTTEISDSRDKVDDGSRDVGERTTTEKLDGVDDDRPGDTLGDNADEYGVVEGGYVDDTNPEEKQQQREAYYEQTAPYGEPNDADTYEGYAGQNYPQDGQEYVEYADDQYGQYPEEVENQRYEEYQQDPNQTYDYSYDDPNRQYENNPDGQTYDYDRQTVYADQTTYEGTYDDEDGVGDERSAAEESGEQKKADPDEGEIRPVDENVNGTSDRSAKKKDVIKSLLDSDTDTTIERNVSNTESDFDFN